MGTKKSYVDGLYQQHFFFHVSSEVFSDPCAHSHGLTQLHESERPREGHDMDEVTS